MSLGNDLPAYLWFTTVHQGGGYNEGVFLFWHNHQPCKKSMRWEMREEKKFRYNSSSDLLSLSHAWWKKNPQFLQSWFSLDTKVKRYLLFFPFYNLITLIMICKPITLQWVNILTNYLLSHCSNIQVKLLI